MTTGGKYHFEYRRYPVTAPRMRHNRTRVFAPREKFPARIISLHNNPRILLPQSLHHRVRACYKKHKTKTFRNPVRENRVNISYTKLSVTFIFESEKPKYGSKNFRPSNSTWPSIKTQTSESVSAVKRMRNSRYNDIIGNCVQDHARNSRR